MAVAELTGKVADTDVVDRCHGNSLLPDSSEAEQSQRDADAAKQNGFTDTQSLVEKQLDTEYTVVPSLDKGFEEGM